MFGFWYIYELLIARLNISLRECCSNYLKISNYLKKISNYLKYKLSNNKQINKLSEQSSDSITIANHYQCLQIWKIYARHPAWLECTY